MNDATQVFEEHRPLLLGLAYRLLGSMWDAEDAVQEGFLRWMGADRSEIREPRAFLVTVVSRIALDQLKSARVTTAHLTFTLQTLPGAISGFRWSRVTRKDPPGPYGRVMPGVPVSVSVIRRAEPSVG